MLLVGTMKLDWGFGTFVESSIQYLPINKERSAPPSGLCTRVLSLRTLMNRKSVPNEECRLTK